jgi:Transposase DDE domain/Insertion element 4 transposase N-terminal
MPFRIRTIGAERNLCNEIDFSAVLRVTPPRVIRAALDRTGAHERRYRKLPYPAVVLLLIALNLYSDLSIKHTLTKVARPLRLLWPDPDEPMVRQSAFAYRRYELGVRPLAALFHDVCRPLSTPQTPNAFQFGLRLVAIDGTVEDAPNTPDNERAFGRHTSGRGTAAFVQLRCVYLVECGTHVVFDAGFWPSRESEWTGAWRVLRSVQEGMLVLLDRLLYGYDFVRAIRARGAHVLVRLKRDIKPTTVRVLEDGSVLARIEPRIGLENWAERRKAGEHVLVRIITYRYEDTEKPGKVITARLLTTLLDPKQAPALELVTCYHERWEIELVIDEIDSHQRIAGRPLRSKKPVGVIQELYALLIAHYAVRALMMEAAQQQNLDPRRLSFLGTVRILKDALYEFAIVSRRQRGDLYARLLREIACERLPERALRSNPRVVRRKMSKFKLKRPHHANWPQPQLAFRERAALI